MKSKPGVLTIILIVVSIYLIYLSSTEYYAYLSWEKSSDETFEMGLNRSSESLMKLFTQNYTSIESNEWKIAQIEDKIVNLQNEVTNDWHMDTYFEWLTKAKMHFYMALLTIFMVILSWRIDTLKSKDK